MESKHLSPIQEFYKGKTIFLTGGTGFLGKVLLEKLLRCCSEIEHVYVMVRNKKEKTAEQRILQLFDSEFFDSMRKKNPGFRKKVSVVYGDLESPALGINDESLEKIKKSTNIIIHSAARVSWDNNLRLHAQININATRILLNLAKEFEKLEALVYISTLATNKEPDGTIPERVPKKCVTPEQLTSALEWMDDEVVNATSKMLLKEELTLYFLTKAMAENVVKEFQNSKKGVPTAIVRSSYMFPVYQDPYPGWCDTIQGAQGIGIAIGKGVLRALPSHFPDNINIIPADVLANSIITAAWYIKTVRPSEVLVVNASLLEEKILPLKELFNTWCKTFLKYPSATIHRYPSITFHQFQLLFNLHSFFDHYLPAICLDGLLYLFTGKTMMASKYKQMDQFLNVLNQFFSKLCIIKKNNYYRIRDELSLDDSQMAVSYHDLEMDSDFVLPEYFLLLSVKTFVIENLRCFKKTVL